MQPPPSAPGQEPWKQEAGHTAYPYGRFASLKDPEGNPLQLWEPVEGRHSK